MQSSITPFFGLRRKNFIIRGEIRRRIISFRESQGDRYGGNQERDLRGFLGKGKQGSELMDPERAIRGKDLQAGFCKRFEAGSEQAAPVINPKAVY
jgi:hypothetical protein